MRRAATTKHKENGTGLTAWLIMATALAIFPLAANAEVTPSLPSPQTVDTEVTFTCDTGDTLILFDSATEIANSVARPCDSAAIAPFVYLSSIAVECDSVLSENDCGYFMNGYTYTEAVAEPGYVSEIQYLWEGTSVATGTPELVYTYTGGDILIAFFLLILILFQMLGFLVKSIYYKH